jgi:hypothetical protein
MIGVGERARMMRDSLVGLARGFYAIAVTWYSPAARRFRDRTMTGDIARCLAPFG